MTKLTLYFTVIGAVAASPVQADQFDYVYASTYALMDSSAQDHLAKAFLDAYVAGGTLKKSELVPMIPQIRQCALTVADTAPQTPLIDTMALCKQLVRK